MVMITKKKMVMMVMVMMVTVMMLKVLINGSIHYRSAFCYIERAAHTMILIRASCTKTQCPDLFILYTQAHTCAYLHISLHTHRDTMRRSLSDREL